MAPKSNGDPVVAVDSARRALVLLGALLYPLSDERAALEDGDAEAYLAAVGSRMRGVCAQSRLILENGLKALADDAGPSRRGRRRGRSSAELPGDVKEEVDRILSECDVPDALLWVSKGAFPTGGALEEIVPLAAGSAAAAVRLSVVAAAHIGPSSAAASGDDGDTERAAAVAGGTVRTAHRIARVIDVWDMHAATPTAIIGCPPPPGTAAGAEPPAVGRRSLGVAAALGLEGIAAAAAQRRARTAKVWSAGGAIQRD